MGVARVAFASTRAASADRPLLIFSSTRAVNMAGRADQFPGLLERAFGQESLVPPPR